MVDIRRDVAPGTTRAYFQVLYAALGAGGSFTCVTERQPHLIMESRYMGGMWVGGHRQKPQNRETNYTDFVEKVKQMFYIGTLLVTPFIQAILRRELPLPISC